MKKKVILGSLLILSTGLLTGCAGQFFTPYDQAGRISFQADEKGMRAFSDLMTGLVNETKTPKGQKSSHYQMRSEQEVTNQLPWQVKMQARFNKEASNE